MYDLYIFLTYSGWEKTKGTIQGGCDKNQQKQINKALKCKR